MSKLISRNNNIIKYKDPSQKLDRDKAPGSYQSDKKGGKLIHRNKIGGKVNIFDNGGLTSYKTEEQANEELKKYADRYKDFYYIELDKANVADVYKNYFGKVNVWLLPETPSYEQALKENVERNKQLMDLYFNSDFESGYIANGPEVSIEGTPHIQLVTYPIGSKKYPFTGHSELWGPDYFHISKGSDESDYNLFGWFGGRNCATETYDFLKEIFGNKFDSSTSAGGNWRPLDLPVNVETLALKLPGAKFKQEGEKRIISIPITSKYQNNYKTAVEKRKNKEYTK